LVLLLNYPYPFGLILYCKIFLQVTNNGTFTVPDTTLQVNGGNVTLTGGGTVVMSSDAFFNQSSAA
jgi:hypothetical protein